MLGKRRISRNSLINVFASNNKSIILISFKRGTDSAKKCEQLFWKSIDKLPKNIIPHVKIGI